VRGADSAMVTLSKGLCAPVGSILCADRESIERARRVRKQLGGGMRQIGHLAAAGLVAVETMVTRLAEDHAKARRLSEMAASVPGARVIVPETNILFVHFDSPKAQRLADRLQEAHIVVSVMGDSALRFVTHNDVSQADCEAAGAALIEAAKAI
jgi:threonine aldolase